MNPEIQTQFASPDPNASPLNLIQLVQLLNSLVNSQITGSYVPYVMGSTTPGVDDQDKAWIELDAAGRPKSIKMFYNGNWRRVYNGMLGEIRGFSGAPGYNTSGFFDVHGLGNVGGDYDGWHICNGQGGTPDLSNKFVCGANLNNNGTAGGYDSTAGWQTLIHAPPGQDITTAGGGQWTNLIKPEDVSLPVLEQTNMDRYSVNGGVGVTIDSAGLLYGVDQGHTTSRRPIPSGNPPDLLYTYPPASWPTNSGLGNPNPTAFFSAPPFYTMAWIIFVGYR